MAVTMRNNASGGVNGAAVTYDNMGEISGDPYDYRFLGAGTSITYATSPVRQGLAYKFSTTTTADSVFFEWQRFPRIPVSYYRIYVYMDTLPSGSIRICEISDGIGNICMSVGVRANGQISLRDYNATQVGASTTVLKAKQWNRLEFKLTSDPTAGQIDFRIYSEADSPYHVERINSAATFNTMPAGNYSSQPRYGITGLSVANCTVYLDELVVSDTGWVGPADTTFVSPLFITNSADMGVDGQVATSQLTGSSTAQFFDDTTGGGTLTFSATQKSHGALSYYFQPTSGNEQRLQWRGLATSSAAIRFYGYFTANPPVSTEYAQLTTSTAGTFNLLARCVMMNNGRISAYDSVGTIWTSTNPISLNTWYRFELYAALGGSATTGTLQLAYYLMDSLSPVESFSTTSANLGTTNIGFARFGKLNANTSTVPFYMDSLAARQQASGYIGPYAGDMSALPGYSGIIPHKGWGVHL